ncbi:MAG TPA: dihydropteroate synthase [Verrucomicrobiota bacterium]|jgi:dihydropteroate synthase|nr:MAG: Dihydropteroate synthase [Verrucomicrobia bacterium ADurb.Bin118]HPY31327.1 dihydropteroate synthase [Verrucomicrobiota bacterium]HQB17732.1 dihydropteroate synthase [Verrucomicrobiota bacterium]
MLFRARQFAFAFPRPTVIMGIVNVTPDSFADGGRYATPEKAIAHGEALVRQGADILDIGGESTRPGATPVSESEELRRVLPVIETLAARVAVPLSIDTMKPAVARAALQAGASIVNDVAANRADNPLWRLVAEAQAGYICMHMQGTPRTMQLNPVYTDVVREVEAFFVDRLRRLQACGVAAEQVVLDIGIGFGKTVEHNLQLLRGLTSFRKQGRPLLLGVSRKSFIGRLTGADVEARLPGSLAGACWAVAQGVQLLRTHDVAATAQAVRLTEALLTT